jgi:hypothetical protein
MAFGLSGKTLILAIVVIVVLLTLGCVTVAVLMPSSTPTATATATAQATATTKATKATTTPSTSTVLGLTPLLQKMEPPLKNQYGSGVSEGAARDGVYVSWTTKNGWNATAAIDDRGTVAVASGAFNTLKTPDKTDKNDPGNVTGFGQAAATAALGHTPNVIHDAYLTGVGDWAGVNMEYLQYDQIFVQISYIAPS